MLGYFSDLRNRPLAGAGVPHDELVSLAKPLLEAVRSTSASGPPASKYIGGDCRMPAPGHQVQPLSNHRPIHSHM